MGQTQLGEGGVGFFDFEAVDAEEFQRASFIENDVAEELWGFSSDFEFGLGGAAGDFQNELRGEVAAAVDLMRVDAALEAVAGVAVKRESASGAADVARGEVGAFEKDVRGAFDDAGFLTTHDASDGDGACVVGNDEVFGEQRVFLAVEREDFFAFLGAADGDAALEFIEVESVQVLAHLHHHIVGDIDDVVDGAEADAFEAGFQPSRAGADFDAFDDAGGVVGAAVGGFEGDFVGLGGAAFRGGFRVIAFAFERNAGEGGEFAGEAEMAEEIGAIRGDLEVEEGVAFDDLVDGFADGQRAVENPQAAGVFADPEFLAAAHHAEAIDTAELAFFDLETAGQSCAGEGERDFVARFEVLRAANDLARAAAAVIDLADAEFVGIWVLLKGLDLSDDDLVGSDALLLNAFHLDAREGQEVGELRRGVSAEVEMGLEPVEGDLHGMVAVRRSKIRQGRGQAGAQAAN